MTRLAYASVNGNSCFTEDSVFNIHTALACDGQTEFTVGFSATYYYKNTPKFEKIILRSENDNYEEVYSETSSEALASINTLNLSLKDLFILGGVSAVTHIDFVILTEEENEITESFSLGALAAESGLSSYFNFSFAPNYKNENENKFYYYDNIGFTISIKEVYKPIVVNSDFYIKITCTDYPRINTSLNWKGGSSSTFELSNFLKLPEYNTAEDSYTVTFEISNTYQSFSSISFVFVPKKRNKLIDFKVDKNKIEVYGKEQSFLITDPTSSNGVTYTVIERKLTIDQKSSVSVSSGNVLLSSIKTLWEGKNYNKIITGILSIKVKDALGEILTDQIYIDFDFRSAPELSGQVIITRDSKELNEVNQGAEVTLQFNEAQDINSLEEITYSIYQDIYDLSGSGEVIKTLTLLWTDRTENKIIIPNLDSDYLVQFRVEAIDSTGLKSPAQISSNKVRACYTGAPKFNISDITLTNSTDLTLKVYMTDAGGSRKDIWNWDYFESNKNPDIKYTLKIYINSSPVFPEDIDPIIENEYDTHEDLKWVKGKGGVDLDLSLENFSGKRLYIKCELSNGFKTALKTVAYSGAIPTVSYRHNAIGINTPEIGTGTETDVVVAISSTESKNKILINNLDAKTTFQVRAQGEGKVALFGFLIDCGTWDDSISTEPLPIE